MPKLKHLLPRITAALLLLLPLVGVRAAALPVAVSILPQKYLVEQIGGAHVSVQVMVRPGFEPASYDPTPRQLAELAHARLYFAIGVPFERSWMPRFRAANQGMTIVDTTRGIQRRPMAAHDHHGDHDHANEHPDPHIWLSPPLVRIQAQTIRDALIAADPEHAADYRHGYAQLALTINRVDNAILHSLARADLHQVRFLVFHPAFGYFAEAYGLTQVPIETEGKEPGPRQLAQRIAEARADGIRLVFVEPQFSQKAAKAIAHALGGRTVTIDPLMADWPAGMQHIAVALHQALANTASRSSP